MVRTSVGKFLNGAARQANTRRITSLRSSIFFRPLIAIVRPGFTFIIQRSIAYTNKVHKGISPESANPQPKEPESNAPTKHPVELTAAQYQELSEEYMGRILEQLEELAEEREDMEVEYSAGVLNLKFPPNGDYVINKQPPNKQIWLSSPISGPKRYDFVVLSEGQDSKEGTGEGEWVYLRDGTTLSELLLKELGVNLSNVYTADMHGDN